MKKEVIYVAGLFLMTACSELIKETPVPTLSQVVYFEGRQEESPSTRAELVPLTSGFEIHWTEKDSVGIFAKVEAENDFTQALGDNYVYGVTPREEGRLGTLTAGSSGDLKWTFGKAHLFYAYYPFSGVAGQGKAEAVPVTLPALQRQATANDAAHLNALCVMKADPVERLASEQEPVRLVFHALYAMVKLEVEMTGQEMTLEKLSLRTEGDALSITEGWMDITAENPDFCLQIAKGEPEVSLDFDTKPVLNQEKKIFYLMVAPGKHGEASLSVTFLSDNGGLATVAIPGEKTFRSGVCYTRHMVLTEEDFVFPEDVQQVKVASATATPYTIANLATSSLYTDRDYGVINLPEKYKTWQVATCGVRTRQGGSLTVNTPGKVYLMTRENRKSVMTAAGWTAVTPTVKEENAMVENSNGFPLLIIWMKEVRAGEVVDIPGGVSAQEMFGGFMPVAPSLITGTQVHVSK